MLDLPYKGPLEGPVFPSIYFLSGARGANFVARHLIRKLGRRCRPSEDPLVCTTCTEYAVSCTWARTPAKRGTKPRQQSTS
jgi:hypothetical protein